ncbi:MAG: shikimate kinase, partial [Candidatus Aminicenantia bacterium]
MINIIITGFMGCGKTTLGRMIAERLKMNFFDTDELIERREGLSVSAIFEKFGEDHFRKIEMEIVKILGKERRSVISTGGKTLLFDENLKVFSEKGVIITLTSEPEILWERIKKEGNRPLIKNGDKEIFMKLHDDRKSLYEKLPNRIDISALSEVKAVEKILEFLTKESKRIVVKIGDKESLIIFK